MKKRIAFVLLACMLLGGCTQRTDARITQFYYRHAGMPSSSIYTYDLRMLPDGQWEGLFCLNCGNVEYTLPVAQEDVGALDALVRTNDLFAWNGFDKADRRILDGENFDLHIAFEDGSSIEASGSNAYPQNYDAVTDEMERVLEKYIRHPEQG